jgi:hypothetical protein
MRREKLWLLSTAVAAPYEEDMIRAALQSIEAPLNFMIRPEEKPRVYMSGNHAEANRRTGEFRMTPVDIADARCLPEPPTLDREGFALVRSRTGVTDFFEKDAIEHVYYPEVVALLQEATGAVEVHIFDHTMRVQDDAKRKAHGTRLPVVAVHNDYTETSGPQRVRDLLSPEKAKRFLSGRFSMVNVWRSIGTSAERFPMAIADGRTVPQADYIGVDIVYPDRVGEIYQNVHSQGQQWYYFSNMRRDEALLLKCFDSARDGRTRYTAHTGFSNPHAPGDTPPRESIEVRTLLAFA